MNKDTSKQIKMGVILSYVFVFFSFLVNFIYSPILTKYLGQSHYGTYSLVISIVGYLEILNNGMASTYIKFASKYIKDEEKLSNINRCYIYYLYGICSNININWNYINILSKKYIFEFFR